MALAASPRAITGSAMMLIALLFVLTTAPVCASSHYSNLYLHSLFVAPGHVVRVSGYKASWSGTQVHAPYLSRADHQTDSRDLSVPLSYGRLKSLSSSFPHLIDAYINVNYCFTFKRQTMAVDRNRSNGIARKQLSFWRFFYIYSFPRILESDEIQISHGKPWKSHEKIMKRS